MTKKRIAKELPLSFASVVASLSQVSLISANQSDAGVNIRSTRQQSHHENGQNDQTTTITGQQQPLITIDQRQMPNTGSAPSWGITFLGVVLLIGLVLYHIFHGKRKP